MNDISRKNIASDLFQIVSSIFTMKLLVWKLLRLNKDSMNTKIFSVVVVVIVVVATPSTTTTSSSSSTSSTIIIIVVVVVVVVLIRGREAWNNWSSKSPKGPEAGVSRMDDDQEDKDRDKNPGQLHRSALTID